MTEAEFEKYILPCYRKMYAAAVIIVSDSDEASDIVQESFTRLWERRDEIPNPNNPEGYCITVARRLSLDRLRRRRRTDTGIEEAAFVTEDTTEITLEMTDSLRQVTALMNELPHNQCEVIKLSAFSGLDNGEIAVATGLSDANVRTLLSRGRKALKRMFQKENR